MKFTLSGKGSPIVLVHGALTDQRMWHDIEPRISQHYSVYSITMHGFSGSEPDRGEAASFGYEAHAKDLAHFIEKVVGQPALVIAWSYGADVALAAAQYTPGKIRAAFLYEPGRHTHLTGPARDAYFADASTIFSRVNDLIARSDLSAAVQELIDGTANSRGYFERQNARDRSIQQDNAYTLPLQTNQTFSKELTCADLLSVPFPLCFARGELTRTMFALATDEAYRCSMNATHRVIAGANHMLPIDSPSLFCDIALEYFDSLHAD